MRSLLNPPPKRETLSANVLQQMKNILISGSALPGEAISLRSTALALGVSIMPVRQAIAQLIADQALEVAPNGSFRVPVMDVQQFREITKIRLHVETFAVEHAALAATPKLIRHLRSLNANLAGEMSSSAGNRASMVLLNKELHFSIYEAAAMPMLEKIIGNLWLRIGPVFNYDLEAGSQRTRQKVAVACHASLIDALEQGDKVAARTALELDINSSFEYVLSQRFPSTSP